MKYKKRWQRSQNHTDKDGMTPRTTVRKFLRRARVNPSVRKRLLFGEVVQKQLSLSLKRLNTLRDKQMYGRIVGVSLLKKYRVLNKCNSFIPRRLQHWNSEPPQQKRSLQYLREKSKSARATVQLVLDFFLDDTNSVLSPGKKEFCCKGGKEKVRYLTDTLVGLHEKFVANSPVTLSYAQFAKLRPPYIVQPKVSARDTCACKKCENYK